MDPLIGSTLIGGAGKLASGLASWFGGGEGRKNRKWLWDQGQAMYNDNTPIIDPNQKLANYRTARAPLLRRIGGSLDRRFGLDSGVGAGQLAQEQLGPEAQMYNDTYDQNAQLMNQRKLALFQALSQLGANQ